MATDLLALSYTSHQFMMVLLDRRPTNWGDSILDNRALKASAVMDHLYFVDEREQATRTAGYRIARTNRIV